MGTTASGDQKVLSLT